MKYLNLLLLFCASIIFCSCTITKRHFGNGYHVEWNRKMKGSDSQKELPKLQPGENDVVSENKGNTDSLVLSEVIETQNESPIDDLEGQQISEKTVQTVTIHESTEIQRIEKSFKSDQKKPENEEVSKRRMHPLMWGIWGMWSIAIACMFFVTFYAEFLIGVGIGFFIAMIFAIIVIRGLRKHREKYRFKGLSYGFAIPAIVFGGIAILGLVIFLLGGVAVGPGG
ncbi:hypothetical protein [Fluviicola taffensis]|uniref:hypothetical protein n=1 Tax=Fluviicola taffensis TaxID=191579 RepID=UPI0031379364